MELIYPTALPTKREDLLLFIKENFDLLKVLEMEQHAELLAKVSFESVERKVMLAGQYYGEWDLFGVDTKEEAQQEKLDGLVYFAWRLLQERFSSVNEPEAQAV